MRLGCGGCLSGLVLLFYAATLSVFFGWLVAGVFEPPRPEVRPPTSEDAARAGEKLRALLSGQPRAATAVFTESETGAIVAKGTAELGIPVLRSACQVTGTGSIEIRLQTPLRTLLQYWIPWTVDHLPRQWTAKPLWLVVVVVPRVEVVPGTARRMLRLKVNELHLGARRLPVAAIGMLVDPAVLGGLRWPLPAGIDRVTVERGHVTVRSGT